MTRVLLADAAKQDRLDVWLHIAADNPAAANRLLAEIDEKIRLLASAPELGHARADKVMADGIAVVRVIHGARRLQGLI